jgi:epoxyqueuosine reductase
VTPEARAQSVKERAHELLFDTVGITHLRPPPHREVLEQWIARGMAGSMSYMVRQLSRRIDPTTVVPGATHAVIVTKNYFRPDRPLPEGTGRIAKYARGRDYHTALRRPLDLLANHILTLSDGDGTARAYVDAGPVPERELAQMAGLGWIGKNTMLLDPRRGSYFFLASVLTDVDLAVDPPFQADRCGTCRRCLDACPTNAFPDARVLDARRCISYLTIEHRGAIAEDLQPLIGDWLFGCDVCQQVCPWNARFAIEPKNNLVEQRDDLEALELAGLLSMPDDAFAQRYGWTAMERVGADGMKRNARIVTENRARNERPGPEGVIDEANHAETSGAPPPR